MTVREAWSRYEQGGADVIRGLNLTAYSGELFCILGGNGVGKSTALLLLSGSRRPYRGKVSRSGKTVALLPQNPQLLFVKHVLEEDLWQGAGSLVRGPGGIVKFPTTQGDGAMF